MGLVASMNVGEPGNSGKRGLPSHQIYDWIVERAPTRGPEWFEELVDCLYSLEQSLYRCPLAREAADVGVQSGAFSSAIGSMPIVFFTKWTKRDKHCGSCTSGMERFEISILNNSDASVRIEVGLGNPGPSLDRPTGFH